MLETIIQGVDMMKKKYYICGLFLMIYLVGCSGKNTEDRNAKYLSNMSNEIVVDQNGISNENEEDSFANDSKSNTIQLDSFPLGDEVQENTSNKINLKNGLKDTSLIKVSEDREGIANLPVNVKEERNDVLLCKDPVYDILYYVNYGEDYFIYRLKDGKSELAVELPARRLFCVGGELFFIVTGYDTYEFEGISDGNILKFNPLTGEVSMVVDKVVDTMLVYDDGIRYRVIESRKQQGNSATFLVTSSLYFYSFENNKTEKIEKDGVSLYKWNDYYVTDDIVIEGNIGTIVGEKLETLDGMKTVYLTEDWKIKQYGYFIMEDKLYYKNNENQLVVIHIGQNKIETFPFITDYTNDFTIIGDRVYYTSLNCMNLKDESQSKLISDDKLIIRELYTDGVELYGICENLNGSEFIRHLVIEEQAEPLALVENNGFTYELGRYTYRAVRIGEE